MINQKIRQASSILKEMGIDLWLTFVRESSATHDPALDLIFGSHVTWPAAFVITADGEAVAIAGKIDAANVADHAGYRVIPYASSIKDELIPLLQKIDPQRIALNFSESDVTADGLTHGMYLNLMEYLEGTPYGSRMESSERLMAALRGRKSPDEIRRIQAAIGETLRIFDEVTGFVKVGHTEKRRGRLYQRQNEGTGIGNRPGIPNNARRSSPAPRARAATPAPTDRPIRARPHHEHRLRRSGGGVRLGLAADLVLSASRRDRDARRRGQGLRDHPRGPFRPLPGRSNPALMGWEVDQVARDYITERGYEEFPHGLGHQVGRQAHDGAGLFGPQWERYKNAPFLKVEVGQVYTIEPRLTVAGRGVSTLEEIVVITEDGCRFLSEPQKELWVVR